MDRRNSALSLPISATILFCQQDCRQSGATMPATTTISLSGNAYIDGVLGDTRWATNSFTYSFPGNGSYYGSGYGFGETSDNFGALSATQQATARAVLGMYAAVANLTFTEVTESGAQHGDIRFARSDAPGTAWAYFPNTAGEGGDIWFNNSSGYYNNPVSGNYAYVTFVHEVGHALGLDHAQEGNAVPVARDSMEYTVMSYRSYVEASTSSGYTNETWGYAQSLMLYDVAAVQYLYGANFSTNADNTTYSWSATSGEMFVNGAGQGAPGGNRVFQTVWDGGGVDTYDFSNYSAALTVSLVPGEWTTTGTTQLARLHWDGSQIAAGNIANALLYNDDARSLIENVRGGSGNDVIVGNRASNMLWGNGGNDLLDGREGTDSAAYSGLSADYRWWQNADGSYSIADLRPGSPDGTDRLLSIDTLVFQDTNVHLVDQSRAVAVVDTADTYAWTQAISTCDQMGALDHVAIRNDDGRSFFTDHDRNSMFIWREAVSSDDAQNTLAYVSITSDDRADVLADHAHTSNVSDGIHYDNAGDQLLTSVIAYDDDRILVV
jgi:serralysin